MNKEKNNETEKALGSELNCCCDLKLSILQFHESQSN